MDEKRGVKSVEVGAPSAGDGPAILVASNGTGRSATAFEVAARLAKLKDGWLVCERIFDVPNGTGGPGDALDRVATEARDLYRSGEGRCLVEVASLSEAYTDENYGRAMMLVDAAQRHSARLIVIGVHGKKRSPKALSATMTEKLLKVTPCPVLIVADHEGGVYQRASIAVDFSDCSLTAVKEAIRFAPQAEFHLVHVGEDAEQAGPKLRELIAQARDAMAAEGGKVPSEEKFRMEIVEGKTGEALAAAVSGASPDLLVLGTKGRSGLAKLVLGSVASRFIADPPCDLLILRSP